MKTKNMHIHTHMVSAFLLILLAVLPMLVMSGCQPADAGTLSKSDSKFIEGTMTDKTDYSTLWKQVEDFNRKGLPKSALKVVEEIYKKAKANNNAGQLVKALIHKMRYLQQVEEEAFFKAQKELNEELKESRFPVTPVLHSMLAEQYWNYYQTNRYRFLERTETSADFKQDDVRTWSLKKIVETVIFHYGKSLEDAEKSKETPVNVFDEVIDRGNTGRKFRPTLYDFLAHRAVDFYMSSEPGLTKPKYQFTLNNPDYFSPTEAFAKLELSTKDTFSFQFYALKYLQDLVTFHLKDKTPDALVDADLKRLRYVYENAVISNKELIYEKTLEQMLDKYEGNEAAAEIYYELACLYERLGDQYKPGYSEDYKWHKKKALELCKKAIKKYPGSIGATNCQGLINNIEGKKLDVTLERVAVQGQPFKGLLEYRNVGKVYLKVVETDREELLNMQRKRRQDMGAYFIGKQAVKQWEVTLPDDGDYQTHSLEIKLDSLDWGQYVLLAANTANFDFKNNPVAYTIFVISNIAYIQRMEPDKKKGLEFYLVDRDTGQPLQGACAQVWNQRYNRSQRRYEGEKGPVFNADKNGYFNIPYDSTGNYFYLELIQKNGEDRLYLDRSFNVYRPYDYYRKKIRTIFFIDRAIYRPGQTVYFKGIMLDVDPRNGEKNKILENFSTQVILYDVNNQKVSELDLKTNEYGTFSGTFQLPTGVLNGNMRIADRYGSVNFLMEEYKRPKFKVTFKPLEKTYRLEDMVAVKGEAKAYAGYAIDNAEVKYRVVRNAFFPYPWYYFFYYGGYVPHSPAMEIASGVTNTDASGAFEVTFAAIPDLMLPKDTRPAFCFTVYADVTDINGETQSSQKKVYIGYTALKLDIDLPVGIDKDQKKIKAEIDSTNLSGEFVKAEGTVSIYKLKEPDRVTRTRLWKKPDKFIIEKKDYYTYFPYDVYNDEDNIYKWEKEKKVFHGGFDTGEIKEITFSGLDRWKTGQYVVEMESKDRFGNEIKEIQYFTLYSGKGKQVPYKQMDWFAVSKDKIEPGEKAVVLIGSSEKGVRVLYEIEHRGNIVDTRYLMLNNAQERLEMPILEKHRGNVGVHVTFVRHNRLMKYSHNFEVPWSNKDLDISFATFRDKLMPGEKEQWQIKIKGPKGEKVAAEMVATLYDASLDAFRINRWFFDIFSYHYLRANWTSNPYFSTVGTSYIGSLRRPSDYFQKRYDRLNWFGFYPLMPGGGARYTGTMERAVPSTAAEEPARRPSEVRALKKVAAEDEMFLKEEIDVADKEAKGKKRNGEKEPEEAAGEKDMPPVQVRTKFNETAFFYPHLKTSPQGEIIISFTIPEALTRWKMMGFAHTRKLVHGFVYNELVTQKDLMVVPNTPRFFREGDTLVYTSKITNLSDKELSGTTQLQLFDAVTMKPVDDLFRNRESQQPFTAKKGQSALVKWRLQIPDGKGLDAVTYRVIAKAGRFSDGEEQAVPILKNRMMVIESLPLPVRAKQTKTFTFKKLLDSSQSATIKHHRITLEFTANPVWYAVQALPFLLEYPYECIEQIFSRYYGNSMAAYIANSNPKIKRVFEIWKSQQGVEGSASANALLSNLEKNQELKTVLLEETPWVLEGQNETQRKQRIALLFDLNTMASQLEQALRKLEESQLPSGGWPWFKGMRESRYITQHIVCGFAHLDALEVIDSRQDKRVWKMLKEAVSYLDSKISEDYQWLLKHDVDLKKNNLGYIQVHYLYARSYFQDVSMDKRDKKAFAYYKSQVKTYWTDFHRNKYMQGMMALIMKRYNDSETATAIVESIKEHALYSEEMGMYWKTGYGYYWYQAPIETQALLIEVFHEVLNDAKSVEEMKTWLLKQKQTQDWRTTKATVEACYALLLRGEDWLKESRPPEITVGRDHPIVIEPGKTGPDSEIIRAEAGTGYFKIAWTRAEIKPDMAVVKVKNNNNVAAWGSLYWQYFENLDKITPAKTPLSLKKKLFVEKTSDTGPVLHPIKDTTSLKIGDRVKVRIELQVDRNMEYVHMKDMRASAFEPEEVISGCRWQDGLGYYQSTKDASTNFFFDYLPKGTYVFEYALRVTHDGNFSNGITQIQCMYAPEFTSHSQGVRVKIGQKM